MFYLPGRGIHKMTITDSVEKHEFGPTISSASDPTLQRAAIGFVDGSRRLLGFHGRWTNAGLTGLGLIFLDTACKPTGGEFVPLKIEEDTVVVPVPEVVKPVTPPVVVEAAKVAEDSDGNSTALIVAFTVVAVVIILLNAFWCFIYFRRAKRRITVLETEKVNWE